MIPCREIRSQRITLPMFLPWLCLFFAGCFVSHSHAATDPPKPPSRRSKTSAKRKSPPLPYIPMLRSRLPRSRTLPIFGGKTLQQVMRAQKTAPRSEAENSLIPPHKQKRLPTRRPQTVQRIRVQLIPVPTIQLPAPQGQGRRRIDVSSPSAGLTTTVRLFVRQRNLGRQGIWRRWTGQILLEQGQLKFFCPLRSFCKTLQAQTNSLLQQHRRRAEWSLQHPRFFWHLRRALEKKYNHHIVIFSPQAPEPR